MKYILKFIILSVLISACDKEVSVSPKTEPLSNSFISVVSNPTGALMFLDGRNTGRYTPDTLIFLSPGEHELTLKLTYYKDTTLSAIANEGTTENIFVDYTNNPSMRGGLVFNSDPAGVNITLDDTISIGVTPLELKDLLPGTYNITYSNIGFRDRSFDQIVESGKTTNAFAVLVDTTIWVDYSTFNSNLLTNNLNAIVIDQANILWIGSNDMGLFSFDRNEFKSYPQLSSFISSNKVVSLNVDDNNRLFIGTDEGLVIKDGTNWEFYNKDNSGLPNNKVNKIDFDADGNIWIATLRGLAKFNNMEWTVYNQENSSIASHVLTALSIDKSSNIFWLGTSDSGLIKFDGSEFSNYTTANSGILTNYISSIKNEQGGGIIWMTNLPSNNLAGGISAVEGTSWLTGYGNLQTDLLTSIYIDSNDNKWIASNSGVVKFQSIGIKTLFTVSNSGLKSNLITEIYEDNSGIIWITTSGGGLTKYKGEQF